MKRAALVIAVCAITLPLALRADDDADSTAEKSSATANYFNRAERHAAARITAASIGGRVRFLADDLLEGRQPGTRGDEIATHYLASEMESLGLEPGAPGNSPSYFQSVPIVELKAQVPEKVSFHSSHSKEPLALGTRDGTKAELVLSADSHSDQIRVDEAQLVFAGFGITAPEHKWDDYKGVDVKGKVVVLLNFNPPFAGEVDGHRVRLWYGRWDYKYQNAAAHGAIGALIIHTNESAGYPWGVLANGAGPESLRLDLPPEKNEPRMQLRGWLSSEGAAKLFNHAGQELTKLVNSAQSASFTPVPLDEKLTLSMPVSRRTIDSANVIGRIPGTDSALRDEAVVYTAHHDHLGTKPVPPGQDGIYNGALDNASGCAALLAIAQAAIQSPPRRSLYFVFTTGEEEGLLGARWFAQHPSIPAGRLAADINIDVINIFGITDDMTVLGLGKSSLDDIVRAAARAQHRSIHGDEAPDKGEFYRSDHFALAKVGVPIVAVSGGPDYHGRPSGWGRAQIDQWVEQHYHQVSDEYRGDWDLSGAVQDVQLQLIVGLRAANADELPHWTPGDEFEAARKAAPR